MRMGGSALYVAFEKGTSSFDSPSVTTSVQQRWKMRMVSSASREAHTVLLTIVQRTKAGRPSV